MFKGTVKLGGFDMCKQLPSKKEPKDQSCCRTFFVAAWLAFATSAISSLPIVIAVNVAFHDPQTPLGQATVMVVASIFAAAIGAFVMVDALVRRDHAEARTTSGNSWPIRLFTS